MDGASPVPYGTDIPDIGDDTSDVLAALGLDDVAIAAASGKKKEKVA